MTISEAVSTKLEPDTQVPRIAHAVSWLSAVGNKIALCGARVEGVNAPPDAPKCAECLFKVKQGARLEVEIAQALGMDIGCLSIRAGEIV